MRLPPTLKWIGLALLGILIAAAIAVAASSLASRQIGLASEPLSAGDALAPVRRAAGPRETPSTTTQPERTTTVTVPPASTVPPTTTAPSGGGHSAGGDDEHGGGGGGGGADD